MMKYLKWVSCMLLFVSCLKTTSSSSSNSNQAAAYVSFLHLAYYSPAVQLYFNDSVASSLLNPLQYTSAYGRFTPRVYDVKFKTSSGTVLDEIPSSAYDSAQFYTLILYNDSVHGAAKVIKIHDDFSAVNMNQTFFRFFNMSPNSGAVDLYLGYSKVQSNRTPADNITQSSLDVFNSYGGGNYSVTIKRAGTDSILVNGSQVYLQNGVAYTIFLDGPKDSLSLNVLTAQY